jgi:hypothetical protein
MRQPVCDESGVGFGVAGAEKPTALWSHHSILRSDETWLPERSDDGNKLCAGAHKAGATFPKPGLQGLLRCHFHNYFYIISVNCRRT